MKPLFPPDWGKIQELEKSFEEAKTPPPQKEHLYNEQNKYVGCITKDGKMAILNGKIYLFDK